MLPARVLSFLYFGLFPVHHKEHYYTLYGRATPFRGPAPPEGTLQPASLNGRCTVEAALIAPHVLLVRTPAQWDADTMCNLETDLVLGARHYLNHHDFVPGQLILVVGEGDALRAFAMAFEAIRDAEGFEVIARPFAG